MDMHEKIAMDLLKSWLRVKGIPFTQVTVDTEWCEAALVCVVEVWNEFFALHVGTEDVTQEHLDTAANELLAALREAGFGDDGYVLSTMFDHDESHATLKVAFNTEGWYK